MQLIDKLNQIESRRTEWSVTEPAIATKAPIHPTLKRVLNMRHLELDVQDWTRQLLDEIGHDRYSEIKPILKSHATDEDKHDTQLQILAEYWGVGQAQADPDGLALIDRWRNNDSHPLAKKLVLEAMGLFQCMALMQLVAPGDLFTQAVRQWVLFDESAHVASARVLLREFKVKVPKSLYQLGLDTVDYLTQDEPNEIQMRMRRIAEGIIKDGVAPDAANLSTVAVPEFFTQTTNQQIPYSA